MSKALDFRNTALRLASRKGIDLALSRAGELAPVLASLMKPALEACTDALLLGTSTPGLAPSLLAILEQAGKEGMLVEPEPSHLERLVPRRTEDAPHTPSITIARGDPANLRIDPQTVDTLIARAGVQSYADWCRVQQEIDAAGKARPFVPDDAVDLVVVDMLCNRLTAAAGERMLAEAFRVLRRHGRLLLVVLLADEPQTASAPVVIDDWPLTERPAEPAIVTALDRAGFHGTTYHAVLDRPVRTIQGVELRAFLVEAHKGKQGICLDQGHAVIYRGPWREVYDDDGHRYVRGERTAVCAKTFELLAHAPYAGQFIGVAPYVLVPLEQAPLFDCNTPTLRSPAVTKGQVSLAEHGGSACGPTSDGTGCCG
jgi:SAM-dependent methyltransferase